MLCTIFTTRLGLIMTNNRAFEWGLRIFRKPFHIFFRFRVAHALGIAVNVQLNERSICIN